MSQTVLILGSFLADTAYRAPRMPVWGETLMGSSFVLGPGGKGSNQAVAAARAGGKVQMITKLGDDAFGRIARDLWASDGVDDSLVGVSSTATGAAAILIDEASGENGIIIFPGACFTLTPDEVEGCTAAISAAAILMTQLELPLDTVERGLQIARGAGVPTILNPAPAPTQPLPPAMLQLADYVIPNETEAAILTGLPVDTPEQAIAAARALQAAGARNVILTLGAKGALVLAEGAEPEIVPACKIEKVVDTTGAGDAFCGGFASALAAGKPLLEAVRFGCATAGLSVTKHGTAASMPKRAEIDALLAS